MKPEGYLHLTEIGKVEVVLRLIEEGVDRTRTKQIQTLATTGLIITSPLPKGEHLNLFSLKEHET